MTTHAKRSFSLPAEQASYIDSLVASGAYRSPSEVVQAGLRALQEQDAAIDRWLREEVVPVYDAMQSDPARAVSAAEVAAALRARHAERRQRIMRDG
jgi:antitoxin ParD1/3/4